MYVRVDQTDYTNVRNIVFSPQTDITGDTMPINEFTVDIITDDLIAMGQYADLYDDNDTLWAHYWITYAERSSDAIMHVRARSTIAMMDGVTLPAVAYSSEPIADVLDNTIVRHIGEGLVATLPYSMSSSFSSATVTGVCPEQSARERLQWVCFVIGAYVKTCFNDEIEILPIGQSVTRILPERTFWRPIVNYADHVTAVEITGYSFATGTPGVGDEYIEVGNDTYIATPTKYTLTNANAPSGAADNVVKFEGVYLVNANNVSAILTHVAGYLFKRTSVEIDAINNGEFLPGDVVSVYADMNTMFGGYVESCAFAFGKQAQARMNVIASDAIQTAALTIKYRYDGHIVDKITYALPIGFQYEIENPYIDTVYKDHRYILRPRTESVTGTLITSTTVTVDCDAALDSYKGTLYVIDVDEIEVKIEGSDTIGVIS